MLGRHHLILTLATTLIIILPLVEQIGAFFILILVGVAVGSLAPDVDATDSAIFHKEVKGIKNKTVKKLINHYIAPILPFFGYPLEYGVYKPLVFVFQEVGILKGDAHRGFSHSILGSFSMTFLTTVYLGLLMVLLNEFSILFLLVFFCSMLFGMFMHMLEDSCTKTGIAWNSPFSDRKLKGSLSTFKDRKTVNYFVSTFIVPLGVMFYLTATDLLIIYQLLIGVGMICVLWAGFIFFVAKSYVS